MTVYVGRDVTVKVQVAVKDEDETAKLTRKLHFAGVTQADTGSHEAYHHSASSEPSPPFGTELSDSEYEQISKSDDTRFSKSTSVNGEYAMMLFRYKCPFAESDVKKIAVKFEGYGTAPAGNGVTMKIWDHISSAWSNEASGTSGADEVLMITLTANLENYIDDDGYIWVLVRTTNPSDGTTEAVLCCDYAQCFIARAKFKVDYVPISDLDQDGVADEPEHVTVKVNGSPVTVSSVNDSTGEVVLASGDFNEDDEIICDYKFDKEPYVAQELTLEPKQRIEGIDGLGSDTIQIWAPLLKEIDGNIKEVFKDDLQLSERTAFLTRTLKDDFNDESSLQNYELTGEWSIQDGRIVSHSALNLLRYDVRLRSGTIIETEIGNTGAYGGIITLRSADGTQYFRIKTDAWNVLLYYRNGSSERLIDKYEKPSGIGSSVKLRITLRSKALKVELIDHDVTLLGYADDSWTMPFNGFECEDHGGMNYLYITPPIPSEHGIIISWDQAGQAVKLGLNGVVFPEGSLPAPKNEPVYIVTPFKAKSIKVIT